ncbi:MAG: isoprenylcysteine carboxylmethyltransferase family protein [Spirochaetales bacterium]|nr:isoprenylcysteine carboxylmethyltransferase family protein [Spirochaetales bacterium]
MIFFDSEAQKAFTAPFVCHRFSGCVLMCVCVLLRFYVVRVLGKSFVINAGALPNQRIIKTGIYRFIRHPAYAAELIGYAGISLVYNQVLSSICAFFLPLAGILIRIHIEEKALIAVLGDEYKDYRKKTKLFIPYLI